MLAHVFQDLSVNQSACPKPKKHGRTMMTVMIAFFYFNGFVHRAIESLLPRTFLFSVSRRKHTEQKTYCNNTLAHMVGIVSLSISYREQKEDARSKILRM